jgi:hypothetical protein
LEMVSNFVPNCSARVTCMVCQEIRLEIYVQ